jgi:beta-glucosidase
MKQRNATNTPRLQVTQSVNFQQSIFSATLRLCALNNEEWCRHNGNSVADEQLLREYYLKPYQVLVQEGKVGQIMAAYNRLNGVPCAGNKRLLTD